MKKKKRKAYKQCSSMYASPSGCIVFCVKNVADGDHDGDHRGDRKQWNREGKLVKITEPSPRV